MKTWKLDGNKKIIMSNFTYDMADTSEDFVSEKLKLKFMFVLEEYWLDIEKGLPYFEKVEGQIAIFKKNADLNTLESILKAYIIDTEEVAEILSFSLSIDNTFRRLDITWTVRTTDEEISEGTVTI